MKKIVAALVLLILSVNLFILIPWQVPLYRGEYVHILQSPGKTEMVMYPCRGNSTTDSIADLWTAKNLEIILDRVLCEGDYLAFYGVSEQVTRQIPRLDKLQVPYFSCGEFKMTSVGISGETLHYELMDDSREFFVKGEIYLQCSEDCKRCANFQTSFDKWKEQGRTDRYLEIGGIKANLPSGEINLFGELDGVRFHATFRTVEDCPVEEFVKGMEFRTYWNDHPAMLPYWLAEGGRILSVLLFVTGAVLLVLGLLPLRKKQTIPDG